MAHIVFLENGRLMHRTVTEVVVQYPNGRVNIVKLPDVWIMLSSGQTERRLEWIYPPIDTEEPPPRWVKDSLVFTGGAVAMFALLHLSAFVF